MQSLDRIIQIWSERNIYEATALSEYKKALHSGPNGKFASNHKSSSNVDLHSNDKKRRDHAHTHSHHHSSKSGDEPNTSKKTKSSNNSINVMNLLSQTNAELPVKGEDVDPNDLIKSLKALEQTASCDAAVRERISKLPPELSDMSLLAKIENKEQMNRLSNQVEDAHRLLSDYHQRLVQELEERKQVSIRLAAYHRLQKLQMQEAEKHLSEYQQRLEKVTQVKDGLRSHLQNLPDLTLLPSVTGGLAPLPTPNDLFTASKLVNPRQQRNDDTDSSNSSPIRAVSSPIMLSPNPPAYEPIGVDNKHDDNNIEIEAEYVPSAVKFNEAGGIATSYSSAFVPWSQRILSQPLSILMIMDLVLHRLWIFLNLTLALCTIRAFESIMNGESVKKIYYNKKNI